MEYAKKLNTRLKPQKGELGFRAIDLFAGCGGLALGFEAQGFLTIGFEKDADCCKSYAANLNGDCIETELSVNSPIPRCQVMIGGPPCQPFSVGGKQQGLKDSRDGFPAFLAAVEKVRPEIFIIENVRGLLYKNKWYFEEISDCLMDMGYIIEYKLLNAVDYGVPQNRERLFIAGHKGIFKFPKPAEETVSAGKALGSLVEQIPKDAKFLTPNQDEYVAKYERASFCKVPRDLHLEKPSRTVTCRNLAGATGDMMRIKLPDGRRRRLTVREAARLQSFPDWYKFIGAENSCFNQIGNAVPPMLSYHIATCVVEYLNSGIRYSNKEIERINRKPMQLSIL